MLAIKKKVFINMRSLPFVVSASDPKVSKSKIFFADILFKPISQQSGINSLDWPIYVPRVFDGIAASIPYSGPHDHHSSFCGWSDLSLGLAHGCLYSSSAGYTGAWKTVATNM